MQETTFEEEEKKPCLFFDCFLSSSIDFFFSSKKKKDVLIPSYRLYVSDKLSLSLSSKNEYLTGCRR
jgi:hypothetical protein